MTRSRRAASLASTPDPASDAHLARAPGPAGALMPGPRAARRRPPAPPRRARPRRRPARRPHTAARPGPPAWAAGASRLDAVRERSLHQRMEARGGRVQDEQLHVGGQRRDQRNLLEVALGVRAGLLGRVEIETLKQAGPPLGVHAAAQPAEEVDDLAAGEVRPQGHIPRHISEPAMQRRCLAPGIAAEQPRGAAAGPQKAEQDPDRRRLPGAVWAEEAVHLALGHAQVQPVQRYRPAVRLAHARHRDSLGHEPKITLVSEISESSEWRRRRIGSWAIWPTWGPARLPPRPTGG